MICKGCGELNGGICRDCYKWQKGELRTGKEFSVEHIEELRGNHEWSDALREIRDQAGSNRTEGD